MDSPLRIAVICAGWAGLAAAVEATLRGRVVTLFDLAPRAGGRARGVWVDDQLLDNGQHIAIGAYVELLRLMHRVGVSPEQAFARIPLALLDAHGVGLQLHPGKPATALGLAIARHPSWRWRDKFDLIRASLGWAMAGFECAPSLDVATLTRDLPMPIRLELIDPLCIAALNTPAHQASASVFLRILRDALLSGPGSSDLLLPRVPLSQVFPEPALHWLEHQGAALRLATRVMVVKAHANAWQVDGEHFDAVVVATSPAEAARLVEPIAEKWADSTRSLRYEPIVTVYMRSPGTQLPGPMLALRADARHPAQFVFDRGQLGGATGLLAFVISGAQSWVDAGTDATVDATQTQAQVELGGLLRAPLETVSVLTEKRATFRCTPLLRRPPVAVANQFVAAGDYVDGPYPATLEGAVRSGVCAISKLG